MSIILSNTDTSLLLGAAGQDGCLILPVHLKPATAQRLIGRLTREGLVKAIEEAGGVQYRLTREGYAAVGARPKRARRSVGVVASTDVSPSTKKELVRSMLLRAEGASLAELVEATGWLPHTTRAALSRLRSSGVQLLRSARVDDTMCYRIAPTEPQRRRSSSGSVTAAAA